MSIPSTGNLRQATDPTKPAGLTHATCRPLPSSREGRIVDWLRGVADDTRISVLHRLVLVRLGLHRRDDGGYDALAAEVGVGRSTILRAVDIGVRRGWLLAEHGERVLTFPALPDRPLPPVAPSTTPRRAP